MCASYGVINSLHQTIELENLINYYEKKKLNKFKKKKKH